MQFKNVLFCVLRACAFIFLIALPLLTYAEIANLSASQPKQTSLSSAEEFVISNIKSVIGECSDYIWPQIDWAQLNLLFVDSRRKTQTLYDLKDFSIQAISNDQLSQGALSTYFDFIEMNEKKTLSLNLKLIEENIDNTSYVPEQLFTLSLHEGFHYIGQSEWTYEADTKRGTEIPILYRPRYLRFMVLKNLRSYFTSTTPLEYLGRALYWYSKWKAEYPSEYKSSMDRAEGTARYVDQLALAVSKIGCKSDEDVFNEIKRVVLESPQYNLTSFQQVFSLDTESYPIGSLATFILKKESPNSQWYKKIENGSHPLDLLLELYKPIEDVDDELELEKFKAQGVEANKKVALHLGDIYSKLKNKRSLRINIPVDWIQGSFSPLGMYSDTKEGYFFIPLARPLKFQSQDSQSKLSASAHTVFFNTNEESCNNMGWQTVLDEGSYNLKDTLLALNSTQLTGKLKGKLRNISDGRFIFCAGE